MEVFVHVLTSILLSNSLQRLTPSRVQIEDRIVGEFVTRSNVLAGGRLELDLFRLVPDSDHVG